MADDKSNSAESSELASAFDPLIDGVGAHGLSIFALSRALQVLTPIQSTKFPSVGPLIQQVRQDVSGWVAGGLSRNLYGSLYDVQQVHGYFKAAILPLVVPGSQAPQAKQDHYADRNLTLWSDAKVRATVLRNLRDLTAHVESVQAACGQRQKGVVAFGDTITTRSGDLAGVLRSVDAVANSKDAETLRGKLTADQSQLATLNANLTSAIGKTAAAAAGTAGSLIVGGGMMAASPATGPAAPIVFGLGALVLLIGTAVGGVATAEEGKSIQELQDHISSTSKTISTEQARILELQSEMAAASVLSSQIQPLSQDLSSVQRVLSTEISAWALLTKQLQLVTSRADASQGLDAASGSHALRAITQAMAALHTARNRAVTMLSMELLPVIDPH